MTLLPVDAGSWACALMQIERLRAAWLAQPVT
jgi:hypothetical protein